MPFRSYSPPPWIRFLVFCCPRLWIVSAVLAALAPLGALAQAPDPEEVAKMLETEIPDDPGALMAVVGNDPILLGELLPRVESRLSKLGAGGRQLAETEEKFARAKLIRGLLVQTIQTKMFGEAFLLDQVGTQAADARADALKQLRARARRVFYENELPMMMEDLEVTTLQQVDDKLREEGSSLEMREREYCDAMIGQMYVREILPRDPEISLNEILAEYRASADQYDQPARARWEQLTVRRDRFASRDEAYRAIAEMGNEVYFGGNLQTIARQRSQEPLASKGGVHDWTGQGSLASDALDQQIFSLPLNELSQIIEDADGFHIIRVLERKPAGRVPLAEVQEKIRKKLQGEKLLAAEKKLLDEIRQKIPVWTLYPEDLPGAQPLPRERIATAPGEATTR